MFSQEELEKAGANKEGMAEAAVAIWEELNAAWAFPESNPALSGLGKNGNKFAVGIPEIFWEDNCKAYAEACNKFRRMSSVDALVEILLARK